MDLEKIIKQESFTKEDIVYLLGLTNSQDVNSLLSRSNEIKENSCGKDVSTRGVIKFSNYCTRLCTYCGLRENNHDIRRYRLSADEILDTARKIYDRGIRSILLQSGQDNYYDTDVISFLVYSIKKEYDISVSLSVGERRFDEYNSWKIAGADGYFLRHETSNPELYPEYHSGSKYWERIDHIKYLKQLGYRVGTGNIIGLPKQELCDIADDIILCKKLGVDSLTIAPFIPAKFTPHQNHEPGSIMNALKTIAVVRLVLPDIDIAVTPALDSIDKSGEKKGLDAGANVLFTNFTPPLPLELYPVYSNKSGLEKNPNDNHELITAGIELTGSIC